MRMFQALTPDEQQAIMNQLGPGGALDTGTSALTFGQSLGKRKRPSILAEDPGEAGGGSSVRLVTDFRKGC